MNYHGNLQLKWYGGVTVPTAGQGYSEVDWVVI
jgi:hypothetical protein